jgi:predicted Zn-ribbon and HTH transcriptional regulator
VSRNVAATCPRRAVDGLASKFKIYGQPVGTDHERSKCLRMWKFLSRVLNRSEVRAPASEVDDSGPSRLSSMMEAIDEGVSQRSLPTLVCRKCGLKYNNTGTYLSGSQCPDCAAAINVLPQ